MSDKELEEENDELRADISKCKKRIQELEKTIGKIAHVDVPSFGDEVQALPNIELIVDGKVYYKPGDKGRVSKDSETTTEDGIERFEVAWYRTGLVSTMKTNAWVKNFRFCSFGRIPETGDEVQVLPAISFMHDSQDYYKEGDKGRVCKNSARTESDGIDRFEVAWYRTGKVSTMKTQMWVRNFKFVMEDEISGFSEQAMENFIMKLNLDGDGVMTREDLRHSLRNGVVDSILDRKRDGINLEPKLGDEMEALPGIELIVNGTEYYIGGDVGRVSKETYVTVSDGIKRFEVTWYRTGLVSTMKLEAWLKNFKYVGRGMPVPLLGDELLCLQAAELTVEGKQYYKPGDKGRVSRDEYIDANDNISRIEISWYRTGLTSTMKTEVWFKYFQVLEPVVTNDVANVSSEAEKEPMVKQHSTREFQWCFNDFKTARFDFLSVRFSGILPPDQLADNMKKYSKDYPRAASRLVLVKAAKSEFKKEFANLSAAIEWALAESES